MESFNQLFNPTIINVVLVLLVIIVAWLAYKYVDLRDTTSPERMRNTNILNGITAIVDRLEGYEASHASEVAEIAEKLGQAVGFNKFELENLKFAALLHDVGEILLTSDVMSSDAAFDSDMFDLLHVHPLLGERYLRKHLKDLDEVPSIIRWHHERWDGLGYPDNLKGEEIPKSARVLALADAVSAMSHKRVYRPNQYDNPEQILSELERQAGLQFDPDLVKLWSSLVRKEMAEKAAEKAQQEAFRVQKEIQDKRGINVDFSIDEVEAK